MFAFLLHPFKCLFGSTTADETEHVHAGTKAPYGTTVDQVRSRSNEVQLLTSTLSSAETL